MKAKIIIVKITKLPVTAFDHLQGKEHTPAHRMKTGVVFMAVGVCLSCIGGDHLPAAKMLFDGVGYLLHGAGCTPFIDHFAKIVNQKNK
jgi:hypothetical protein